MFTRRSVLQLIAAWIDYDIIAEPIKNEDVAEHKHVLSLSSIKNILINASQDFDWETRRKCNDVIMAIMMKVRRFPTKAYAFNILQVVWRDFYDVLVRLISDCEYKVKLELVRCFQELRNTLANTRFIDCKNEQEHITEVKTFEDFAQLVKTYDIERQGVSSIIQNIDFGGVGDSLKEMDDLVRNNICSFLEDIISSAKQTDANLLDCY